MPTANPTTGVSGVTGVVPAARVPGHVRAARLDLPLAEHSFDPTYADAHLERIVRAAADDARESARAQGYALGWSQGQRAAAEQAELERESRIRADITRRSADSAAMGSALSALESAATAVRQAEAQSWDAVADGLTDAAVRIVEALLARELNATDDAVLESARTALRSLGGSGSSTVRLNPADLALVRAASLGSDVGSDLEHVEIAADPTVPPGSAEARLDDTQVLVDLPAVVARIEAVMGR
jgi:flagellar assembly protein FliH